jgi:hypothetical protein
MRLQLKNDYISQCAGVICCKIKSKEANSLKELFQLKFFRRNCLQFHWSH